MDVEGGVGGGGRVGVEMDGERWVVEDGGFEGV